MPSSGLLPSLGCYHRIGNTGTSTMHLSKNQRYKFRIKFICSSFFFFFFQCLLVPSLLKDFVVLNYLLLLVGMFPVVAVFRGLVRRRSLGRMCHRGEVVSHRDAPGHDALHGCWYSSWCHADHPGRVPGVRKRGSHCHLTWGPNRGGNGSKGDLSLL